MGSSPRGAGVTVTRTGESSTNQKKCPAALKFLGTPADRPRVTLLLAAVAGWCLVSALAAFGLGPLLHRAADLTDRHEAPPIVIPDHFAA